MPDQNPKSLSEVLDLFAPQGANDRRWLLADHQLEQARLSVATVVGSLKVIAARPENEEERQIASDCLSYAESLNLKVLETRASFLSYLSGTSVPDRMSQTEV